MLNKISATFDDIINKIEELIKQGNLRRIIIRDKNNEVFMEIPIIIGVLFTLAAPIITAIAAVGGLLADFTVELIKKDNSRILLLCEKNSKN